MQLCIQWILFAKRALKLEEYYFAVLSGLCPDELSEWDLGYVTKDDMSRFLLSSSEGLAETTKGKSPTVQFIHESVREFFLKDGLGELWPNLVGDFQSVSHDQLRECCHIYTQLDISAYVPPDTPLPKASSDAAKSLRSSVSEKFPFLEYAIHHVLYHADVAESKLSQDDFLKSFRLEPWISLSNLFEKFENRRHTATASLLYILAERNLARLIRPALCLDARISIKGERHQHPLFAALANGHRDVVRALFQDTNLARKNDISTQLEYGKNFVPPKNQTPLQWVIDIRHLPLAIHLIASKEFSSRMLDDNDQKALSSACGMRQVGVQELLRTTKGHSMDLTMIINRTLLPQAAADGNESAVKMILEIEGVDANSRNNLGQAPL